MLYSLMALKVSIASSRCYWCGPRRAIYIVQVTDGITNVRGKSNPPQFRFDRATTLVILHFIRATLRTIVEKI